MSRTAVRVRSSALFLIWAFEGDVEQKRCARSPRRSFKNSAVNSGRLPAPWSMMSLLCDRGPAKERETFLSNRLCEISGPSLGG